MYGEINGGAGKTLGVSGAISDDGSWSGGVAPIPRAGVGGGMIAGGKSTTVTFATSVYDILPFPLDLLFSKPPH